MTEKTRKTPFTLGNKLGKGRPPGAKNKIKAITDVLGDPMCDEIIKTIAKLALEGCVTSGKTLIDYILANSKLKPKTILDCRHIAELEMKTTEQVSDMYDVMFKDTLRGDMALEDLNEIAKAIETKLALSGKGISEELDMIREKFAEMRAST